MKISNLSGRITVVTVRQLPGDEIEDLKANVKEFAVMYKCKIKFNHNEKEFICDSQGNIAQTN